MVQADYIPYIKAENINFKGVRFIFVQKIYNTVIWVILVKLQDLLDS